MNPHGRLSDAVGAIAECTLALLVAIGITLVLTVPLAVVETRYEIAPAPGSKAAERELLRLLEESGIGSSAEIIEAGAVRELRISGRPDVVVTLESTDGAYSQTIKWTEAEAIDGGVVMTFKNIQPDKSYNLKIDPGAEGEAYYVAKNVKAPLDKLKKHCQASS